MNRIIIHPDNDASFFECSGQPQGRVAESRPEIENASRFHQPSQRRHEMHLWRASMEETTTMVALVVFAGETHVFERITSGKFRESGRDVVQVHDSRIRAGLPTTVVCGGTSLVTTAPMPTTAPSPMTSGLSGVPWRMTAPVPM